MKRLIPLIVSLFACSVGWGAITIAKTGSAYGDGSANSFNVTWTGGGSSGAGDTIVVYVFTNSGLLNVAVSDSGSNVYTSSQTWVHSHGNDMYVWSIANANAATTVTVTTAYNASVCEILDIQGLATSNVVDKTATVYDGGYGTNLAWTTNASGTLSNSNELVLAFLADSSGALTYSGTGCTQQVLNTGCAIFSKTVSATDSVTLSGTTSGTGWCDTGLLTYVGASVGSATYQNKLRIQGGALRIQGGKLGIQ